MDISSFLGIAVALFGIVVGNAIEGGHFGSLIQFTAFIIVFGGTLGATMLANRASDLKLGLKLLGWGFRADNDELRTRVAGEIVDVANFVRKESMLAAEGRVGSLTHPFMRKVFKLMVDGTEANTLRDIFEKEMETEEDQWIAGAKVWMDAGGYAPTIGILGAVLGLIHVMGNLTNTSELGKGIAVAFVATIYGVGSANLLFLPIANKIQRKAKAETRTKEMILEGAISIVSGMHPRLIQEKMDGFLETASRLPLVR
ncbi:MAG: flagellar motor protein [Pseudobdellovibrionaceae bacterium]|nr:flagellar motor protein [Bdellovibrionales bacterium]USN46983.1 MAG: flagellar motor protein [Pseudobdellovibrionaceae bacterium]